MQNIASIKYMSMPLTAPSLPPARQPEAAAMVALAVVALAASPPGGQRTCTAAHVGKAFSLTPWNTLRIARQAFKVTIESSCMQYHRGPSCLAGSCTQHGMAQYSADSMQSLGVHE